MKAARGRGVAPSHQKKETVAEVPSAPVETIVEKLSSGNVSDTFYMLAINKQVEN